MAWPPLGKSKFTVRIMDRFKSFFHGIDRQNDPDAAKKSKALKLAQFELSDQHYREKEITDADIDAAAKEALAKVKPDNNEDEDSAAPSARATAPTSAAKPVPAVVDHSATISALNTRLASMEKELSALKAENVTLKTAAATSAAKPIAPSKIALAEAALAAVKERKAKGDATGLELATAAFQLEEAKRQEKADAGKRPLAFTAEDAAKLSHHEKELRLAHLAHAFDQCNGPQGRNALWTINKDEIRALCAGSLAGWMTSFRTS